MGGRMGEGAPFAAVCPRCAGASSPFARVLWARRVLVYSIDKSPAKAATAAPAAAAVAPDVASAVLPYYSSFLPAPRLPARIRGDEEGERRRKLRGGRRTDGGRGCWLAERKAAAVAECSARRRADRAARDGGRRSFAVAVFQAVAATREIVLARGQIRRMHGSAMNPAVSGALFLFHGLKGLEMFCGALQVPKGAMIDWRHSAIWST